MNNDRITICRKIKLTPLGDKEERNRVFQYIRNGQYAQYQACNLLMGQLISEYYKYDRDIKNEDFKARQKEIMKNSNPLFHEIEFAIGNDTPSAVTQKVKADFNTALKNGLAKGERSVTNYKRTNPLITRGRSIKKLKGLSKLKKREQKFVETYCHMISRRIVDFALINNAKYINLEYLQGYDTNEFVLRNWSYYKIQQYCKYKASIYGIVVRFVNPCYNAQVCSFCGHWSETQRISREVFKCENPNCISHKLYKDGYLNADFNNARNVALSSLFVNDGNITDEKFKEAREYYDIDISR